MEFNELFPAFASFSEEQLFLGNPGAEKDEEAKLSLDSGNSEDVNETEDEDSQPSLSSATSGTFAAMDTMDNLVSQRVLFQKGDDVFIKTTTCGTQRCDPYWYPGQIIGTSKGNYVNKDGSATIYPCYQIHYDDSSTAYDEWVYADCLMSKHILENQMEAERDNKLYFRHQDTSTTLASKKTALPTKKRESLSDNEEERPKKPQKKARKTK